MSTRRHLLRSLFVFACAVVAGAAAAAPPTVEIIAMGHPPVQAALAPLRAWLAQQDGKVIVKEIDMESGVGLKRLEEVGLSGHVPILILVDGQYAFRRKDGSAVAFVDFPNVPGSPPGIRGNWVTADIDTVLDERIQLVRTERPSAGARR